MIFVIKIKTFEKDREAREKENNSRNNTKRCEGIERREVLCFKDFSRFLDLSVVT